MFYRNIILHVPHSSADFSFAGKAAAERFGRKWLEQANDLIDWYTDELFVPSLPDSRIESVIFDTCRTLCDVERMSHDPLEAQGLGITNPHCLVTDMGVYDPRLTPDGDSQVMQKYIDHQYHVASLLAKRQDSILIDCHSFSNDPTLLQPDATKVYGVDICIGFNNDFTRPSDNVIALVQKHFLSRGYRVGINVPFSNSKTVDTPACYHSLMIEVNKYLYMDETTLEKDNNFDVICQDIQSVYKKLLK